METDKSSFVEVDPYSSNRICGGGSTECDRVRMRNQKWRDPGGVSSGVRIRNRVSRPFSGVFTENDVTLKKCNHAHPEAGVSCPFFCFPYFLSEVWSAHARFFFVLFTRTFSHVLFSQFYSRGFFLL